MINPIKDHELLEFFRNDATKEKAFELIIKKYQEKIYWQIRRQIHDHNDADDIMQEVFIKVWKSLNNFREDSQLYTWIFRIASNECINFHRKNKQSIHTNIDDASEQDFLNKVSDNPTEGHKIQRLLAAAIDTLPEKQKMVFHLKYYQELKYEEIAEMLGTSVGALKASFHIAVKKIEQYLTEH